MAQKLTMEQLLEALKDPATAKEAQKILKNDGEERLASILKGVEVTDEDTLESLSRKHQDQIRDLVTYFNDQIERSTQDAVTQATADTKAAKEREIQEFSRKNPGMDNAEIIEIMQPLYDKGESIEKCYAKACRALELDPTTGKPPVDPEEGNKKKAPDAKDKDKDKKEKISSMKSDMVDDPGDDTPKEKDDDTPISIEDSISANMNMLLAKDEYKDILE